MPAAWDIRSLLKLKNMEALKRNIYEAISCHFDEDMDIPTVVRLHFVREEILHYD